jgi:hypothetical protein
MTIQEEFLQVYFVWNIYRVKTIIVFNEVIILSFNLTTVKNVFKNW